MVILVAEISGGVWAYMNRAELHKMVRETVRNTVQKEYTKDNVTTTTFDMIQQSLQCCGSHDYKSWFGSAFHPGGLGRLDIGVSSQNQNISHVVPESCCVEPGTPECKKARQDVKPEHNPKIIYTEVNSLSFSSSSSPPPSPSFLPLPPSSSLPYPPLPALHKPHPHAGIQFTPPICLYIHFPGASASLHPSNPFRFYFSFLLFFQAPLLKSPVNFRFIKSITVRRAISFLIIIIIIIFIWMGFGSVWSLKWFRPELFFLFKIFKFSLSLFSLSFK